LAQWRFGITQVSLFVASFGALGHHLPGMIRAYGDRALFSRFKYRFLFAPAFIGTTCALFGVWELDGIVLVAYLWGVWHALMQTYGFLRIYDAKRGSDSPLTARLDRAMCIAWFGAAVLWAPTRMFKIFSDYYAAGGPAVSAAAVSTLVDVWTFATAALTVVYAGYLLRRWLKSQSISQIKLLFLISTVSFWWYTNAVIPNMLIGIALFEVFHDVQYLAIVWTFNVNRVERTPQIGRFTAFLFRRSWSLVGVYVGLVVGYGWLNLLPTSISSDMLRGALRGLIVGSTLLHFYYDSFIWKVRERDTRESLGLVARTGERTVAKNPTWLNGLKWAPLIGVAVLLVVMSGRVRTDLERGLLVVSAAPASDEAHNKVAVSLLMNGHLDAGVEHLRQALSLNPLNADAHSNLGLALARGGKLEQADAEYREAIRIDPNQIQAYSNRGNLLMRQGNVQAAIDLYGHALQVDPDDPQSRTNLAGALLQLGRTDEAIEHLERVLRRRPGFAPAQQNLGVALAAQTER
jgi:Flp pilus assembly protein TadD